MCALHKHKGLELIGKTGGVNVKDIAALADRMLAIIEGRKTMKKTMKKTLSAALAAALSLSAFAGITVNAQDSYEDYVPGEKAANLIPDASDRYGYTYFGANHLQIGTVFWQTDSEINGYYVKYSYTGTGNMSLKSIGTSGEQWRGNGGFWLNGVNSSGCKATDFVPEAGKTYAFSANVKNASAEGVTPNFSVVMNDSYNPARIIGTNEYGKQGMKLSDKWSKFNATLTLPDDYDAKAEAHGSDKMAIGMPDGTPEGSAFMLDVSSKDAVYLAEEQAYDISVDAKKSVDGAYTVNAKMLNQLGITGGLPQNFEWTVLDADKTPVTSGFSITQNGASAEVAAADGIAGGTYYVYAKSTDYNIGKSVKIYIDDYKDYVPGEKAANLIEDASAGAGSVFIGNRHNGDIAAIYDETSEYNGISGHAVKYQYSGHNVYENGVWQRLDTAAPLPMDGEWRTFESFELKTTSTVTPTHTYSMTFEPKDGATYVVSAMVKNASPEGITPYFGAAMNNTWDPTIAVTSKEYGETGMQTDSTWKEFKATLTLPQDYTTAGNNGEYKDRVFLGFPKGTAVNSAVYVDVSSKDAVYLAEEQVYDISVKADAPTNDLSAGGTVTASAQMLNQVGTTGTLAQNFEWVLLDSQRNPYIGDYEITGEANTANLTLGETLPSGVYYLYAKSADYEGIGKALRLTVEGYEDYVPGEKAANLIEDASAGAGSVFIGNRHNGDIAAIYDETSEYNGISGHAVKYQYSGHNVYENGVWQRLDTTAPLPMDGEWRIFESFELRTASTVTPTHTYSMTFEPKDGATYVVSAMVKNASPEGITPYFGAAMNNTWSPANAVKSKEYGEKGMQTDSTWKEFKATLTLPQNYTTAGNNGEFKDRVFLGFPKGTAVNSAVYVDVSSKDAVYLAEEQLYNIKIDKEKVSDTVYNLTASVVNQIGTTGTLKQNFKWVALDADKNETDAITIEPIEGTSKVKVDLTDAPGTRYIIAAKSTDYEGFVRTVSIDLTGKAYDLYVAADGVDTAEGTEAAPLKTLAGAKAKVRALRTQGNTDPIDVNFAGGTYYFSDETVFDKNDSQEVLGKVTYKAKDGEKVVFTGAVPIDLSSAQKVSNENVLSRLKDSVKDKVVEIDLTNILSMTGETISPTASQLIDTYEYPELYLNGSKQNLAQWPNGDANYAHYDFVGTSGNAEPNKIQYTDDEPSSWADTDNVWIGGYMSYDYLYMRLPVVSVDKDAKQITMTVNEANSLNVKWDTWREISHRWKAFNVLEELDTPTEWYIDKDTMKLYYYPPKTGSDAVLEISKLAKPMIKMNGAENIGFEGIEFENTRGSAIEATDIYNVTVKNCSFRNIGTDAFAITGSQKAWTDKDYWQRQNLDAAYNCEISDNVFYNIGGHAVVLDGGNVDTLTPGNNVLKNNIFNKCAQTIKNYETILVKGCGNSVVNNNISRSAFQAIRHYGNDHVISYNEIYNVLQETDDCGAIYCGRNTVQRGTVISYNYLHDLYSTDDLPFKHQVAIYWDDNQTGMKAYKNIIRDAQINVYTNGVDNEYSSNTSINIKKTNIDFKNGGAATNQDTEGDKVNAYIKNPNLYYGKYANLKAIIDSTSRTEPSLAKYNVIKNNLSVAGTGEDGIGLNTRLNGTCKNNENITDTSIFVNPTKQDYRIKNSSLYAANLLNESFDIEKIGVQSDNAIETSKVELVAPYDGEKTDSAKIHFVWNDSPGATLYTVTVATDSNFTSGVVTQDSYYNFADIEIANNSDTYYWKVTAKNTSREFAGEWTSDVQSFTNGEKISVTAELGTDNSVNVSLKNNYYADGKNADAYIVEYDGQNNLIAVSKYAVALEYKKEVTLANAVLKKPQQTAHVKLFVWDILTPLMGYVTIK